MASCFLCGMRLKDLRCLRQHFSFVHSDHEFIQYNCNEADCRRSFQLFSSFKRHFDKEHKKIKLDFCSSSLTDDANKSSVPSETLVNKIISTVDDKAIRPECIVIGQRMDEVKKTPITCEEHFIPLRQVLENFFSLDSILLETFQYMDSLKNKPMVENFIQGSYWKMRMTHHSDKIVLPLFMYFEDYAVGNVLGSQLEAVYASIPCLPPWRSSVLTNIFLLLLFHSSDRTEFGNNVIFQPIIDEFNFLSEEGIQINIPNFNGKIYFDLALILGDNLGLHSNFSCRVCKVSKNMLKNQLYEDTSLLRKMSNYDGDLAQKECVFLGIKNFDIIQQVGPDIIHDVFEGVAKNVFSFILLEFTETFKFFSLDLFNKKLLAFDYGLDTKNKPRLIEKDHLKRKSIPLSSGEMITLIRYFGLLVGDLIPRENKIWTLYITLRKIVDIIFSESISDGTESLLQVLVSELNELYIDLTKEPLKSKFHSLIHYHTAFSKFGSLSSFWSMRIEAKQRQSKISARASSSSCNRMNITLTLAKKHQLELNEIFIKGKLSNILSVGPERNLKPSERNFMYSKLQLDTEKTLMKINWAMMSSVRYENGSILVKNLGIDCYNYEFCIVRNIYLYDFDQLIFTCTLLDSLGFDEHYFAYEVEIAKHEEEVIMFFESFPNSIPNTMAVLSNGRKFIVLRSPL